MADSPKIFPLGDNCVTVDFGNEISIELNNKAISLANHFAKDPFPGFVEAVPAYSSLSIFYNVIEVRRTFPEFDSAFAAVAWLTRAALEYPCEFSKAETRPVVEIPVDFGADAALDINFVAEQSNMSPPDVVDLFTAGTYRVYMLGFLPGFAYMGEVDERIAVARKAAPRTRVPKGSVGIASRQTGIYPLESPGGWQIIGQTNVEMFAPDCDSPCLLAPGDEVRFVPLARS
ncbi:MAG TPA: 5-oxoprolinase subunit PxpB [Pyrinomonadaceae bacterium]|nr:5-oxoprolinase subunit PxpB [Pyrinomonadaceae bacterium]